MIDFTTVIAVDPSHRLELSIVWPTWKIFRPELLRHPLLVICDGTFPLHQWQDWLTFLDHPDVRLVSWNMPDATQREKMLSALVFVPGREVATPWYLKLDTDTVAIGSGDWLPSRWFSPNEKGQAPVFVSVPWNYTKPADAIQRLDTWGDTVATLREYPRLNLLPKRGALSLRHRRIISWCFFGQTSWTRTMADACPQHLPVPSQDTFLWYCAARRREFFRRVAMISYGWRHVAVRHDAGLSRLRNVAHRALASEVPSALSEPAGAQRFATEPLQPSGDEIAATGRANAPYPRQEEAPSPRDVRRDRGIVYLLTGPGHGARLAVSLWSLRRYYQGPVTVYTTRRESHAIGQRCANDRRLCVEHRTATEVARGKNSTFLTKVKLLSQVPYTVAAFLDADTVIAGTIDALLEVSCEQPFCATQFSDWTTSHHLLRNRIDAWRGLSPNRRDAQWLAQFLDQDLPPRPAVNSGVIGFRADAAILGPWYRLAMIGRSTFICEEIALQLLLPHYSHKLLDCRYNCSPIYGVNRGDARIWHLHGEKHLARPEYREIWLPLYQECLRQNIAGLREWTPGGDRQLLRFVEPESDPQGNGNCSPG